MKTRQILPLSPQTTRPNTVGVETKNLAKEEFPLGNDASSLVDLVQTARNKRGKLFNIHSINASITPLDSALSRVKQDNLAVPFQTLP